MKINTKMRFKNKINNSISLCIFLILFITFELHSQNFQLSKFEHIFNGDFSFGNTGFFTDYEYSPSDMTYDGQYIVTSNPSYIYPDLASCFDHTPGPDSLMLVINGASDRIRTWICWEDSIYNILPNTDYLFSFWGQSSAVRTPANIEIRINGLSLPQMLNLSSVLCRWDNFQYVWNSGSNSSVVITILDTNTEASGNDFDIDDISLRAICNVQADAGQDEVICEGQTIQIGGSTKKGFPPYQYLWEPAAGLNNPNIANPTVNINTSSTFNLTVTESLGCVSYDTVEVTVIPFPQNKLTTDKPTTICPCDSVRLIAPLGDSYLWSTGETTQSISVRQSGTYSVRVNNQNLCYLDLDTVVAVVNNQTTVQLDTVYGEVGDYIVIPFHIVSPVDALCALGQFDAEIRFNKSILVPTGSTPFGIVNGDEEIINISDTASGKFLQNLEFIATLGNTECTDIKLSVFRWSCNLIQVDSIYGRFCLKNLCREPIVRLFDDNGTLFLKQVRPNPASDKFKIDFGTIEDGVTTIEIYNFFGEKVTELFSKSLMHGQYTYEFDISYIEPGAYIMKMQTPNNLLYRNITIIR
ncbi:MAG: T9SS type A sorting domain-containing protein [Ignavibacteriae bacterium]|nr:T9SS type A sorting domain-containing protein [Ignavibacteriota bacterium]